MFNFYVQDGKKLIDYKPKLINYARALERLGDKMLKYAHCYENMADMKIEHESDFIKILYLSIKTCSIRNFDNLNESQIENEFYRLTVNDKMIGAMTPREFMRMFPIAKQYNGAKYGFKDYFYSMNYINDFGMDTKLGNKASEFLFEYWNNDINEYMVYWIGIVNRMNLLQGGKDITLEFMEEQGIDSHFVSDGEYMIDTDTGEKFKIVKPKSNVKKLFSV